MVRINTVRALMAPVFLFCLLVISATPANAQIEDTGKLIQSGIDDSNILIREYLKPAARGFGAGLNAGWFNSASTHSVLGFDVTFRLNAAIVPGSDKAFDIAELGLQKITLANSGSGITPTASGSSQSGPEVVVLETVEMMGGMQHTLELARFTMPAGSGFGYVPTPMLQASVGLPTGTDIIIRMLPTYTIDEYGSFSLWGLGVKHDLKTWLPGGDLIPFDLSVMAGYTNFTTTTGYTVEPGSGSYETDPGNYDRPETWDNQRLDIGSSAFTVNALIGKTFPVITLYGGVGYETSTMNIKSIGNYPVIIPEKLGDFYTGNRELDIITDPLDIQIRGTNNFRALAGLRLKLLILTISADYTVAEYSMASVGVGFSFR
ncbi:MAG: hypothetical protein LC662_08710 [Rhodothermaceae bacterium]|nr:hypothetical protein [Rhodothermaceae bacterium]